MLAKPLRQPPPAWSQLPKTGEDTVDIHHRQLIELAGLLWQAVDAGRGEDIVRESMVALHRYAEMHFAYEEAFFDQIRSPLAEEQRADHRALAAEIGALATAYRANATDMPAKLKHWIESRLIPHLGTRDLQAVRAASPSIKERKRG